MCLCMCSVGNVYAPYFYSVSYQNAPLNVGFCVVINIIIELPRKNILVVIMGNVVFSIIWLLILIFIAFWVAGIAAGIYIIVLPFTVCIEPLTGLTDFLLSVIQFPKYCAQAMMEGKGFN